MLEDELVEPLLPFLKTGVLIVVKLCILVVVVVLNLFHTLHYFILLFCHNIDPFICDRCRYCMFIVLVQVYHFWQLSFTFGHSVLFLCHPFILRTQRLGVAIVDIKPALAWTLLHRFQFPFHTEDVIEQLLLVVVAIPMNLAYLCRCKVLLTQATVYCCWWFLSFPVSITLLVSSPVAGISCLVVAPINLVDLDFFFTPANVFLF